MAYIFDIKVSGIAPTFGKIFNELIGIITANKGKCMPSKCNFFTKSPKIITIPIIPISMEIKYPCQIELFGIFVLIVLIDANTNNCALLALRMLSLHYKLTQTQKRSCHCYCSQEESLENRRLRYYPFAWLE